MRRNTLLPAPDGPAMPQQVPFASERAKGPNPGRVSPSMVSIGASYKPRQTDASLCIDHPIGNLELWW